MNKELYIKIKTELNNLEGEYARPKYVCEKLIGQKLLGKNAKDQFTVIYAFYEYMKNKKEYYFIKEGTWNTFYQKNFSKYLTKDVIKREFDEIIGNDGLLNVILTVCNDDVKKNLYEYAKTENFVFEKAGNKKYKEVFEKIEEQMIKQGLVKAKEETPDTSNYLGIKDVLERKEPVNQNTQLESKDIFNIAAETLGADKSKLVRKTDKLLEKDGKDIRWIDRIVVEPSVMQMLSNDASKAAAIQKTAYQKFKERIRSKTMLHKLDLDIIALDEKLTLVIKKKEGFLDKIASSDNAMVRAIHNSAREKLELFKQLVKPSAEVTSIIKQGLVNTSNKFAQSIYNTKQEVKAAYGDLKENLSSSLQENVNTMKQNFEDTKNVVTHYSDSVKDKISNKLYDIADKISPSVNLEKNAETQVEPQVYDNNEGERRYVVRTANKILPNGKRIVVKAATKAGEIHKPINVKVA